MAFPTIRCLALLLATAGPAFADYSGHPRVPELLDRLASEYGFSAAELEQVRSALANAQRLPQLVEQEQKAPEKTETWTQYARRIDATRIEQGIAVLHEHAAWFARAEEEYGVPPAMIAGVLGIETRYGRITGSVRVLDALSTQGFEHPSRHRYFFSELAEYFAFCRELDIAPTAPQGSYAGAMGAAQFMPSNYRRLAVDFDGDGRRDLWRLPDAIGSIARYLTEYDPSRAWRRGEPVIVAARLTGAHLAPGTPVNGRRVTHRAADLPALGLATEVALPPDTAVGIIELELDNDGREYWVALANFYSVMTYNPRVYYAMAVAQLARRIDEALLVARQAEEPPG
ncbi:membrane-bound lytic murein transglycosylase B [Fontimonas thermophila]|uniref:Membrane-bound lytic murein transglycosylase B n=1 Tax=Fontimonas thermophila TaxID=1076937 RepID=A0A1I2IZR5_9GAMM|nr:lytic murein transglycosylase [Fontimonas thermophila]SFF47218.1 membrane-bound lytic murein transglycosylase B [Fontimonas thermophila]